MFPPDTLPLVFEAAAPALKAGPCPDVFSSGWLALADDDPRKQAALIRAALAWVMHRWSVAEVGEAIYGADPKLWRRVASDRAQQVPRQRDRSVYSPVGGAA